MVDHYGGDRACLAVILGMPHQMMSICGCVSDADALCGAHQALVRVCEAVHQDGQAPGPRFHNAPRDLNIQTADLKAKAHYDIITVNVL